MKHNNKILTKQNRQASKWSNPVQGPTRATWQKESLDRIFIKRVYRLIIFELLRYFYLQALFSQRLGRTCILGQNIYVYYVEDIYNMSYVMSKIALIFICKHYFCSDLDEPVYYVRHWCDIYIYIINIHC